MYFIICMLFLSSAFLLAMVKILEADIHSK